MVLCVTIRWVPSSLSLIGGYDHIYCSPLKSAHWRVTAGRPLEHHEPGEMGELVSVISLPAEMDAPVSPPWLALSWITMMALSVSNWGRARPPSLCESAYSFCLSF